MEIQFVASIRRHAVASQATATRSSSFLALSFSHVAEGHDFERRWQLAFASRRAILERSGALF
jgi:hypothetical protein